MLKALFRKQLSELNSWFYQDKKTGKNRSKAGIAGYTVLYAVLCIFLCYVFFFVGKMLCAPLVSAGIGWLYHAIMCLMALFLGVFGSVFNTYSTLYKAKDNELLLSMPIPPSKILMVRLFGVWMWGFIYEAIVLIPAFIVYMTDGAHTVAVILSELILLLVISLFILTVSCGLGWLVAKISAKIKAKSLFTVVFSLIFLAVYFFVYSQANKLLQKLLADAGAIGENIKGKGYPLYVLGRSAEGDILSLLIVSAVVLALFGLVWLMLSRSFLKLATAKSGDSKKQYRETVSKVRGTGGALLQKEVRHFLSSATYMLNCGLGTVMLVVLAVAALIKSAWIREMLAAVFAGDTSIASLIACAAVCMVASMNDITAPSVSLEGKTIWLVQSLPVTAWQVLRSKLNLHLIITEVPVFLCSVILAAVIRPNPLQFVMMILIPMLFVLVMASFGLMINLKMPNLTWTNETAVVKQSVGVMIAMFGGWAVVIALGVVYAILYRYIPTYIFMPVCAAVLAGISAFLLNWLKNKGSGIFERL